MNKATISNATIGSPTMNRMATVYLKSSNEEN